MDKKVMAKVFGGALLRSLIILMAVLILGFAIFFAVKVVGNKSGNDEAETTEETSYSDDELQAMLEAENATDGAESTEATEATEAVTEEVTTEEMTTEAANIPSVDKNILVLNSTKTTGLAAGWASKLNNSGCSYVATGNYSAATEETTKIYVSEEGMGKDIATYFNGASVSVGSVDAASYSVTGGAMDHYDIIIVVGNSDSTVQ